MSKKTALIILSGLLVSFTSIGAILARNNPKATAYGYLTVFSNVVHLVDSNYVEEVEFNKVMDSALQGMVENLDSESFFVPSNELEDYKKSLKGTATHAGIGLTIARRFGMVVVVAVEKGSPAEEKKIKPGDFIRSIDGQYVQPLPPYKIERLMRGVPGSEVKISMFKGALEKPEDFTLIRKAVTAPYIDSFVAQVKIGYIRIRHLMPGVEDEIKNKLESFQRQGISRMILDVRSCADDNQDVAVRVADLFVGDGPIVQISGREGEVQKIPSTPDKQFTGEMLVLVDYTTSGGAEIIASALQDSGAGKVFGVRTFGRGGIQKLLPAGDNWVVLTTQKYLSPKGKSILTNGVEPSIQYKEDVRALDIPEDADRMLDKAIELLRHSEEKAA